MNKKDFANMSFVLGIVAMVAGTYLWFGLGVSLVLVSLWVLMWSYGTYFQAVEEK